MNWETLILGFFGLGFIGDIIVRLIFKSNRRIENAKADNAEIEVAKNKALAHAEAKKALEEAHAVQCRQYEERIKDLHTSLDMANEQIKGYIMRDDEKEERFDKQTEKLRDVQRKLLDTTLEVTEYVKKVGKLELELEKVRCNDLQCPFRLPPNIHTPPKPKESKEEYFKNKKK